MMYIDIITRIAKLTPKLKDYQFSDDRFTDDSLKINNIGDKRIILFTPHVFASLDIKRYANTILRFIKDRFGDEETHLQFIVDSDVTVDKDYDEALYEHIARLHAIFKDVNANEITFDIHYQASKNVKSILSRNRPMLEDFDISDPRSVAGFYLGDSDDDDDDNVDGLRGYDDSDDDDDDDGKDSYFNLKEILGADPSDDDDDDDEDDDDRRRGLFSREKFEVRESEVFDASENPKKEFHRHGILIADKEAIKKDKALLKEFLLEFLPGDDGYIRELRKELAIRWMDAYAITEKEIKKLNKEHRRKKALEAARSITGDILWTMDRRIQRGASIWADPNK